VRRGRRQTQRGHVVSLRHCFSLTSLEQRETKCVYSDGEESDGHVSQRIMLGYDTCTSGGDPCVTNVSSATYIVQ
jgi:hypothetical protein